MVKVEIVQVVGAFASYNLFSWLMKLFKVSRMDNISQYNHIRNQKVSKVTPYSSENIRNVLMKTGGNLG